MYYNYNLPENKSHLGILLKFQHLKNTVLEGKVSIKGSDGKGLNPDELVPVKHLLHDLIRGFYIPKAWKCMLSYQTTEKLENYGKQIEWEDETLGEFKKIIMNPPNNPNDTRATNDIKGARFALQNKIPIGILHNIEKGKNKCLGLGIITEETNDGKFIVKPILINPNKYESKINTIDINYFSFKTNDSELVKQLLSDSDEFEFGNISNHYDSTKANDIVFLVLGGDKPKWDLGLRAICTVSAAPYDKGYNKSKPKYYKIKLRKEIVFPNSIAREEIIPYLNCYNMTFIGPMTKGEPNQANSKVSIKQTSALVRALIDFYPNLKGKLSEILGSEIMTASEAETDILVMPNKTERIKAHLNSIPQNDINSSISKNRIIYGAPGTGKSYSLKKEIRKYFFNNTELFTRVTFHPQYSYSQFVGTYKPVPVYQESKKKMYTTDLKHMLDKQFEPLIDYQYVAGPFIKMLEKAKKDKSHNYLLLIEEMNRANAASVFGDMFQLLDRNDEGESEYEVSISTDLENYLISRDINISNGLIKIPSNLYIWATMNSADQGVMAMDTAFKRRWSFEYMPLNKNENENGLDKCYVYLKFIKHKIKWNIFRNLLNDKLKKLQVDEDKLIGPFFLKKDELKNEDALKNKLLLYLRDDVLRHNPQGLFYKSTFSDIITDYDNGKNIFKIDFENLEENRE